MHFHCPSLLLRKRFPISVRKTSDIYIHTSYPPYPPSHSHSLSLTEGEFWYTMTSFRLLNLSPIYGEVLITSSTSIPTTKLPLVPLAALFPSRNSGKTMGTTKIMPHVLSFGSFWPISTAVLYMSPTDTKTNLEPLFAVSVIISYSHCIYEHITILYK